MGSLSLGMLAICLDTALSCCSSLEAETYPAWSRHWRDSQGTFVVSISFPPSGTSMLSAKPLLNRNLQQEPWSRSRFKNVLPFCLPQAEVRPSSVGTDQAQFSAPFPPMDSCRCSQNCNTALIPYPLPKPRVKGFKSPGVARVLLSVGNDPLIHLSKC